MSQTLLSLLILSIVTIYIARSCRKLPSAIGQRTGLHCSLRFICFHNSYYCTHPPMYWSYNCQQSVVGVLIKRGREVTCDPRVTQSNRHLDTVHVSAFSTLLPVEWSVPMGEPPVSRERTEIVQVVGHAYRSASASTHVGNWPSCSQLRTCELAYGCASMQSARHRVKYNL